MPACSFRGVCATCCSVSRTVKAFRPVWQDEILDEVARNSGRVLRRQYDAEKAEQMTAKALAQMAKAFPDAALSSELWTPVVSDMTNDVKDRHVLAAAVGAEATHVVTDNTRDFPVRSRPAGVKVVKPDAFLLELLALDQDAVFQGVEAIGLAAQGAAARPGRARHAARRWSVHETVRGATA